MGILKKEGKEKESKDISPKIKWIKNTGHSLKGIFLEWFSEQPLFEIVNGEIKRISKENKKKKLQPKEKVAFKKQVANLSSKAIDNFIKSNLNGESPEEVKKMIKDGINGVISGIKTGDFYKKTNLFGDDPELAAFMDELEDEWEDDDVNGSGESIMIIKDDYLKKIKLTALAESNHELAGPIPALSNAIVKLNNDIVKLAASAENLEPNNLAAIETFKTKKNNKLEEIKKILGTLAYSDKRLNILYRDSIADSIMALITTDNELDCRDIVNKPAPEIISKTNTIIEDISKVNPEVGEKVEAEYEPVKDSIKEAEKDFVYSPVDPTGLSPVAELTGKSEAYFGLGEATFTEVVSNSVGVSKTVSTALGIITAIVATPLNLLADSKNKTIEKKYGSALNIKQPLIATDDLSKDIIASYSKWMETSTAIEIKQALESSMAKADGGNLITRSKDVLKDKFTKMNMQDRSGKDIKDVKEHDRILSSFSQSYDLTEALTKVMSRNPVRADFVFNIQNIVASGEAGEFINDNRHAPTSTIQVEIMYKDNKNVTTFDSSVMSKKASMTIDVSARKLPYEDVVSTFVEMNSKYFSTIKVTPYEKNTDKVMKNSIKTIKQVGSNTEKALLKSNKFADIINKVEKVSTPLFHVAISLDAYHDLKERGLDLKDSNTYKNVMRRLPIISIAIIDEDSEIVSVSQGQYKMYKDIPFKDLEGEISRYEKELQSMIKYGMQR